MRALILLIGLLPMGVIGAKAPEPVVLTRSERFELVADSNGVRYAIDIALPRDFDRQKTWPLVLTLDADYAFALTRNIAEHFSDRQRIPAALVVSVGYPGGIESLHDYRTRRSRDYTPTHSLVGGYGPEYQKHTGGGGKFATFLREQLLPALSRRYHVDEQQRTFVGHSYGGLFGAYLLTKHPALFQRYLIVSPSLWFDDQQLLKAHAEWTAWPSATPARVFLAVGADENPLMANDLGTFADRLCGRSRLKVFRIVFPDENHDSVFPAALSRGLRVLNAARFPDQCGD